jgi:hypothetical protein
MSEQEAAIIPRAERVVDFYGDQITVALVGEDDLFVPLRTLTEYMGLAWSPQRRRVERDEVLAKKVRMLTIHGADGRPREMTCLPLDMLPGWLFGLTVSKVKPELAPKLQRYREECFRVLWREFQTDLAQRQQQTSVARSPLAQVREMGLAIAQLAEQQMALEGRVDYVEGSVTVISTKLDEHNDKLARADERLDRAAQVVGQLQQRLGAVERRLDPAAHITEEQAAEISNRVKALAQLLTEKDPSKNHYQAIFGELYRRFRVSSYKLVPESKYPDVLSFLDDWLQTSGGELTGR